MSWTSAEASGPSLALGGWSALGVPWEMGLELLRLWGQPQHFWLHCVPMAGGAAHRSRGGQPPRFLSLGHWSLCLCFECRQTLSRAHCPCHPGPVPWRSPSSGRKLHKGLSLRQTLGQGEPVSCCGGQGAHPDTPSVVQLWGWALGRRAETPGCRGTARPPRSGFPEPPALPVTCGFD